LEAEFGEFLEEPCGAGGFAKGRGRYSEELELPAAELGLVQVQPGKGRMELAVRGESGDAGVGGHKGRD
jgi:hypothetical protein